MNDTAQATNLFGPLDQEIRARLRAVMQHPSEETWKDARSIMLNASMRTLWQAVIAVDPTCSGVPDAFTLHRALRFAVSQ